MAGSARVERRRLAAILAADVVGYAGLIAADEAGTLSRLRVLFREVVQPQVAAHGGRIFRLLGDAVLAEFSSAVEALRCAIALQAAVVERAAMEAARPRVALRIGIALGDVVVEGGDLYGDGVNVAARLEALAESDGILVSAAIAEQSHGRVDCVLEDAGPLALKNIPSPVHGFRIRRPRMPPAAPSAVLSPGPPSLVVMPFANLSGDPAEDYVAAGVTEELTMALARVRWFHVVSRRSASAYGGGHVDLRRIGQELGVRYVLEGSVRRAGDRLRIVGQLVDTGTGRHVWADRFEGSATDLFALQDAVAEAVAGAVEPSLERAEVDRVRSKPTASLDAHDLYFRSLPLRLETTEAGSAAALALLRGALALEPGFAAAKAAALLCHNLRVDQGWDRPGEREDATRLAREAHTAHGDDPLVLASVVHVLGPIAHDTGGALAAARGALALNPNSPWVQNAAGWANFWAGNAEVSIAHFRRAIRLNSHDADVGYCYAGLGHALLMAGQLDEALSCAEAALGHNPSMADGHRIMIATLHMLGRQEEALGAARSYRMAVLAGANVDAASIRRTHDRRFGEQFILALRASGLPE